MNKWIIAGVLLATAGMLQAKQLKKPDENTLWLEDGKEIGTGARPGRGHWLKSDKLEIKSKEDGKGFSFFARGMGGKTAAVVDLSPEYPYFTFRITGIELLNGYRNWTMFMQNGFSTSQVTAPEKGIYVYDLYQNLPEKERAGKISYLFVHLYHLRLDFEYMKLVKKPDYAVRAECADPEIKPGSKVKFTAELAKEAEDVAITLMTTGHPRSVNVNGKTKIQLKPTDKTQKIWTAEVEIKSIGLKKAARRFGLFMKMDVLGGDLEEPVWVGLPYIVSPK